MKIRQGFISNSSSSSFVVQLYGWLDAEHRELLITEEQCKILENIGFVRTYDYADRIESTGEICRSAWGSYYGFYIYANQDDVTYQLVKNRIPFKSVQEYDAVLYSGEGPNVVFVQNPGKVAMVYGVEYITNPNSCIFNSPLIEIRNFEEYYKECYEEEEDNVERNSV